MPTLVVSKLSKASRANLGTEQASPWVMESYGALELVILGRAPSLNHRATQIRRNVLKARDCKSLKSFQDSTSSKKKWMKQRRATNRPNAPKISGKKSNRAMPGAQIWIWSSTTNKRLTSSSARWLQQKSQGRNSTSKPLTFDKSDFENCDCL